MPFNCIAFLYKLNVPFLNISLIFLCRGRHLSPQVDSLLLPLYCSLPTAARISILNVTMKMSLSKHANEALLQFKVQSRLILRDFHALTQTSPHHVSCFSFHLNEAGLLAAPDHDEAVFHHRCGHCASLNFPHTLEKPSPSSLKIYIPVIEYPVTLFYL